MTELLDPAAVWRDFCNRMAEAGTAVLRDPAASGARNQAEGLRCLTRQLVFAVQDAVEFRDADFPAFHRFDDDAVPDFYIERLDRAGERPQQLTLERMAGALEEAAGWVEASIPSGCASSRGSASATATMS